jgi:hypothetical protein
MTGYDNRYNEPRFCVNASDKLFIMKLYVQARPALNGSLRVAMVAALMLTLTAALAHGQSKPNAGTITVYQDPG